MKTAKASRSSKPSKSPPSTEIQAYGTIIKRPIGLKSSVCLASVNMLNQVLADTMALRDLYKKHHWQTAGPDFYSLHLLFDKHYGEQSGLVDDLAERIQQLGGVSLAMGADVAETTHIERPPRGREEPAIQIRRLLTAHELLIEAIRNGLKHAADEGDDGTNDLLVSGALRTNEMQVWFLAAHLDLPDSTGK